VHLRRDDFVRARRFTTSWAGVVEFSRGQPSTRAQKSTSMLPSERSAGVLATATRGVALE
jgi:hypothetical protein